MTNSVNPVPEGYTSLTPFLVVDEGGRAIDFYCEAFGATVVDRMDGPDGQVVHAELDFGNGRMQLSEPHPDPRPLRSPLGRDDAGRERSGGRGETATRRVGGTAERVKTTMPASGRTGSGHLP